MKDQIVRKAVFGIELRDAFTNGMIESEDASVYAKGYHRAVKKDKYHVFLGEEKERIELSIQSVLYEEKQCVVSLGDEKEKREECLGEWKVEEIAGIPLILITLHPNEMYMLPDGYERIAVEGKPLEEIRVIRDKENMFLLADDYEKGEIIRILMEAGKNVRYHPFRIVEKDGEGYEDFVITEKREAFQYVMEKPLKGRYCKGSRIYELYCVKADKEGKAVAIKKMDSRIQKK
ncbi:MAG: hypothetical protein K2J90_03400 [Lachnospiraceae bacterium]|nr:hypothetical protein [Lachnospiraceae bacterium]